jgi:hypothetical protein
MCLAALACGRARFRAAVGARAATERQCIAFRSGTRVAGLSSELQTDRAAARERVDTGEVTRVARFFSRQASMGFTISIKSRK